MILVTGGTGLVGSHLLFQLTQAKKNVRAIFRTKVALERVKHVFSYYTDNVNLHFKDIDWVKADVTDIPQLKLAFKDVTHVYHCAALITFDPRAYKKLRKINIEGTANIVNLCISNHIEKLCYTSSIATIGNSSNPEILNTEKNVWDPNNNHNVYAISKYGAEMEICRGIQEGVNAVIVNPGVIMGPGFWDTRGSGYIFKRIKSGMLFYATGVSGFVDVWDVVKPMVLLMESSLKNERFILVSENVSFKALQFNIAHFLRVTPPKIKANSWLLELGWRMDWVWSKLTRQPRQLGKQIAKSTQSTTKYDASKIKKVLHYNFTAINTSIEKNCAFFLKDCP